MKQFSPSSSMLAMLAMVTLSACSATCHCPVCPVAQQQPPATTIIHDEPQN
jgi:hypothetical protein